MAEAVIVITVSVVDTTVGVTNVLKILIGAISNG